jgi:hypothetical protein
MVVLKDQRGPKLLDIELQGTTSGQLQLEGAQVDVA